MTQDNKMPAVTDDAKREALISEIDHTLQYFYDEFPFLEYPQVWCDPISPHAGGVSPNDLVEVKAALQTPSDTALRVSELPEDVLKSIESSCVPKEHDPEIKALRKSHDRLLGALKEILRLNGTSKIFNRSIHGVCEQTIIEAEKLQEGK